MVTTELIRDFVNTRDELDDEEALASPSDLACWLESNGLAREGVRATAGDLVRAIELREALRQLLLLNTGIEKDEEDRRAAFGVLHDAAARARIELCFDACAGALEPSAAGVKGALGRLLVGVHAAMADGSWTRLKACRASDCEWAFIDHAKNHSRAWCSMRSCGNREKARSFRERQRAGGEPRKSSSR